jgi:lysyl-tRNA synthetase class 2
MASPPDWRSGASVERLRQRAHILHDIRAFFHARHVMEVDTPPLIRRAIPESHLEPMRVHWATMDGRTQTGFLHTSPEAAMKRLLVAGIGPIYQMGPVFRADEQGERHNPAFTLLEWYRPGWDYHRLMEEVATLVVEILGCTAPVRISFQEAFLRFARVDPLTGETPALQQRCQAAGWAGARTADREACLDFLLISQVEPALALMAEAVFLMDYPPQRAAMARIRPGSPPVAERFELYVRGVELANGYQELTNHTEQRQRLIQENQRRIQNGQQALPVDERFLAALAAGLPECAGVALGVDRLIMLAVGGETLDAVMPFTMERI